MPSSRRSGKAAPSGSLKDAGGDALHVVVDYVKQETLTPLKSLGRFLALGVAGSAILVVGLVLILVGFLRVLQTETGTALSGNLSWVPYGCVAVVTVALMGLATWRVAKGPATRRRPEHAAGRKPPAATPPPTTTPPPATPPLTTTPPGAQAVQGRDR